MPEELAVQAGGTTRPVAADGVTRDAAEALLALGFREAQVRALVAELASANPDDGAEAIIRKALARLR